MFTNHISIKNCIYTGKTIDDFVYEPETTCPRCKSQVAPNPIYSIAYDKKDGISYVAIISYCTGCHDIFITRYKLGLPFPNDRTKFQSTGLICSEPMTYSKQAFDDKIVNLSPQFEKIYNQSLAAETYQLDEIAGLGYRKSLEFLIKDFAIHEHPDETDIIKKKSLNSCIQDYIESEPIKLLARRSTWLGNDEAHYVRKHQQYNISDMKEFIQATAYFIGMVLILEKAATIKPK